MLAATNLIFSSYISSPTITIKIKGAAVSADSIEYYKSLFRGNDLFRGFSDKHFSELADMISEVREVPAGEVLVKEGDEADDIFILEAGTLEINVLDEVSQTTHRVATIEPGESVGEVALLDDGPRSATAVALTDAKVAVIPVGRVNNTDLGEVQTDVLMKINLGKRIASRIRSTNESAVRSLQAQLEESEKRAELGGFMSRVLIGTALYTFALSLTKSFDEYISDTTFVTVPILVVFATALALNIKFSSYPREAYGLTLRGWQKGIVDGIVFSIPLIGFQLIVKYILLQTIPSMDGQPMLDFYQSKGVSPTMMVVALIAYALFTPVQEFVVRSGLQSSFQLFLTGKHKKWLSIFLATLLFSSTHLHVSFILAILVFPVGLYWGWLYSRSGSLVAVSVSHILVGVVGLFVIGFPTKGYA